MPVIALFNLNWWSWFWALMHFCTHTIMWMNPVLFVLQNYTPSVFKDFFFPKYIKSEVQNTNQRCARPGTGRLVCSSIRRQLFKLVYIVQSISRNPGLQNIVVFYWYLLYTLYILILKLAQNTVFLLVSALKFRIWTTACYLLGELMQYIQTVWLNIRVQNILGFQNYICFHKHHQKTERHFFVCVRIEDFRRLPMNHLIKTVN